MSLIDIGCNLTHDSFDDDRTQVIDAARAAGVAQMIVTGATEAGSVRARELAAEYPGLLFATAGVHPHHAASFTSDTASVLAELHADKRVVSAGECGLDYFRDFSPRPAQHKAFARQLELAVEAGLPVFLHQREAHEDFIAILDDYLPRISRAVVHCFTDTGRALEDYLERDLYIGITGWVCDERRGRHLKDLAPRIPAERLMIETDAPYLKPRNLRPKVRTHRNEPRWLPWIAGTLASIRGVTPDELAEQTSATARQFFDIPAAGAETGSATG